MSTYRMDDGTIVKTENATQSWQEGIRWDGNNHISVATSSLWSHETLHRSRKGRYWIESWSQYQGSTPHAEWVNNRNAAAWMLANGHDLPDDLAKMEAEVSE